MEIINGNDLDYDDQILFDPWWVGNRDWTTDFTGPSWSVSYMIMSSNLSYMIMSSKNLSYMIMSSKNHWDDNVDDNWLQK